MEQWSKDRGACQTLQLTLTVATLLLRFKLLCQKLIEKMGLLVLCVFGESPGPCLGGGVRRLGPIMGKGAQGCSTDSTRSLMLSVTTCLAKAALQLQRNEQLVAEAKKCFQNILKLRTTNMF